MCLQDLCTVYFFYEAVKKVKRNNILVKTLSLIKCATTSVTALCFMKCILL